MSEHYWKVEDILEKKNVMYKGKFGDATVRICDAEKMTNLLFKMLKLKPNLFSDNTPIGDDLYLTFQSL